MSTMDSDVVKMKTVYQHKEVHYLIVYIRYRMDMSIMRLCDSCLNLTGLRSLMCFSDTYPLFNTFWLKFLLTQTCQRES